MPVREVEGQSGCYQWGESGKIYCGAGAKEKAERQGRAIYSTGWREAETFESKGRIERGLYCQGCGDGRLKLKLLDIYGDGDAELYCKHCELDYKNRGMPTIYIGDEKDYLKKEGFEAEGDKKPYSVIVSRSSKPEKKLMAVFSDKEGNKIKTTHFGQRGASDYTKHGDKERMERYLERHGGGTTTSTKEDWKDPTTAGSLSRWILWNKPSLSGSFADFKRRFGLKGTMKVSKSAEGLEELTHSSVIEGYQPFKYSVVTNAEETETAISLDEFRDGLYHLFMKDKITESDMIGWSNDYEAYLKGLKSTKPPFSAENEKEPKNLFEKYYKEKLDNYNPNFDANAPYENTIGYLFQNPALTKEFFDEYDWKLRNSKGIKKNPAWFENGNDAKIYGVKAEYDSNGDLIRPADNSWYKVDRYILMNPKVTLDWIEKNYPVPVEEMNSDELTAISNNPNLTPEFIEKYKDKLNWYGIQRNPVLTEDLLLKYLGDTIDEINLFTLADNPNITPAFIKVHKVESYPYMDYNPNITADYIEVYKDDLDWNTLMRNPALTLDLIKKYKDSYIADVNTGEHISANPNLTPQFVEEHFDLFDLKFLASNPVIFQPFSKYNPYERMLRRRLGLSYQTEFNALTSAQKSLNEWTDQKWRTKSGKPSTQGKDATGERYLPEKAIKALSDKEYKRTSAKKKRDTKAGKQFSNQPDDIEKKVKKYRSETFEAPRMFNYGQIIYNTFYGDEEKNLRYFQERITSQNRYPFFDVTLIPRGLKSIKDEKDYFVREEKKKKFLKGMKAYMTRNKNENKIKYDLSLKKINDKVFLLHKAYSRDGWDLVTSMDAFTLHVARWIKNANNLKEGQKRMLIRLLEKQNYALFAKHAKNINLQLNIGGDYYGSDTLYDLFTGVSKEMKLGAETFEAIEGKGSKARFTDMPDPKVYRDPKLRQKARNTLLKGNKGGNAGEWSARKAQMSATKYRTLYEKKYGEGKNPYF